MGLHCLLRPVCPKTEDHYGIRVGKCEHMDRHRLDCYLISLPLRRVKN